jgi:cytochrome b561
MATARLARYSLLAILLHWAIAALVVLNIWQGLAYERAQGLAQFTLLQAHKSVGITILLLTLARLGWRLLCPPPPFPAPMRHWQRRAALCAHWGFYLLLLGLPLTGWVMVSASPTGIRTILYGAVPWPHLGFVANLPLQTRKGIEAGFVAAHARLVTLLYLLLALHIGAALKHQFWDRDGMLLRILPGRRQRDSLSAAGGRHAAH